MNINYYLLIIVGLLLSSCTSKNTHSEQSVVSCKSALPTELQEVLGVESNTFNITIPKSHLVTIWCEFYQDRELNKELSYFIYKNHPTNYNGGHPPNVYEEISVELRRINPDYMSGHKTKNGIWSFGGGSGHLVKKDPIKTSSSSTIENLAKKQSIILSKNKQTLLYYIVGTEYGTAGWSDDKKWNIQKHDNVIAVYARLDEFVHNGGQVGMGFIEKHNHPLILGKALPIITTNKKSPK